MATPHSSPPAPVTPPRNALHRLSRALCAAVDGFEHRWTGATAQRRLAMLLIAVFLGALLVIELARRGVLTHIGVLAVPQSHFHAMTAVFTLLLLFEMVELIMALPRSVAQAAGQQFQIMSLILLRQSFKELAGFEEPLVWAQVADRVPHILSDGVGALIIFALLGVYSRLQRHRRITSDQAEQRSFVATKKLIALGLLVGLAGVSVTEVFAVFGLAPHVPVFEGFYTALIFVDVLIVLVSMRYSTNYCVIFRYFGFAVATVLIRLALSAPRVVDAGLGVVAILFSIGLTLAYNRSSLCHDPDSAPGAPTPRR